MKYRVKIGKIWERWIRNKSTNNSRIEGQQ